MMSSQDTFDYCEYLRLQGYRVIGTANSLWVTIRPRILQPAPPFHLHPKQNLEARQALLEAGALGCRWFSPSLDIATLCEATGRTSLYLLHPPYDLSRIHPKARNQTRRGLEKIRVVRSPFDASIEAAAFPVYADNVQRLGLFRRIGQMRRRWGQWTRTLSVSRCAEFWGAWEDQRLVAFSILVFSPWGAEIVCQRSLTDSLGRYPNNALVFHIATSAFERGAPVLSYGLSRFGVPSGGLDHFKKGMAFEEIPLREHFSCHPRIRFLDSLLSASRITQLARLLPR